VYYIEALMNEGSGGDNIAVAWQGPGIPFGVIGDDVVGPTAVYPLRAFAPSPANGATDTVQDVVLTWSAGERASQHAVYLGDDADAVAAADTTSADIFRVQQAGTVYNAGALEWGKTYYWRVDEINAGDADSPWAGKVWSFTTADFLAIEDFESYTDDMDAGDAVFQTWIDGFDNSTGSTVGYLTSASGTFNETGVVHGGGQSMPLDYNNVNSPYYSETSRTWSVPQNWAVNGVDALTLYVRGQGSNDASQPLYVALEDSAGNIGVVTSDDPAILTTPGWTEWSIPLSDFGVNASAVKTMIIGVGNRDVPTPGGAGLIFIDDIRAVKTD